MKKRRKLGTIRVRLTLWYVGWLAVTVLGFSLYLHLELQSNLIEQVDTSLQLAASQLLVDVDDSVIPPTLRPVSDAAIEPLTRFRSALRLITPEGEVVAKVGVFPQVASNPSLESGYETVEVDGTIWRIYTQAVDLESQQFTVWLQIAQTLTAVYEAQDGLVRLITLGLPVMMVIAALGGVFTANRALASVNTITRTVQNINATDMTERIVYDGADDEFGRLTETLNLMLDRLQMAFENERRFTADASHELRTPLTAIKGQIGVTLSRSRTPEEYRSALEHIQIESDRLIRLAQDLLFLTRLDVPVQRDPEPINLCDLLEAVVEQVRPLAEIKSIDLNVNMPEAMFLNGIPDHLIRLFLNLLDNAIKYTANGGAILVSARQNEGARCIMVEDTGIGIAAEHLPHLFDRFYRADFDRQYRGGSGLGLAIAQEIVREHNGTLSVTSRVGQGSVFTVCFPAASK